MRFIRYLIFAAVLMTGSIAFAEEFSDYDFEQERMLVTGSAIYIISTFDNEDHITAYSFHGTKIWDAPFHAKIISWKMSSDSIFVLSKDRRGYKSYLTCVDRYSGTLVWQRP